MKTFLPLENYFFIHGKLVASISWRVERLLGFVPRCRFGGRYDKNDPMHYLSTEYEGEVLFTYDVIWTKVKIPWTDR